MKYDMNRKVKVLLILATLVAVALLTTFWSTTTGSLASLLNMLQRFREHRPGGTLPSPEERPPGDIELYYTVQTVLSSINATLLVCLLITYISIYRKTKSEFTIGLIIFSAIFLLNVLASNPLMHWAFGFSAFGLGPFAMLPDLFTCIALCILLYLSIKY
jgi:hypothetical protein